MDRWRNAGERSAAAGGKQLRAISEGNPQQREAVTPKLLIFLNSEYSIVRMYGCKHCC